MEKGIINISARELVEFVLMSGDITSGFPTGSGAIEGIKGHKLLQKVQGYKSEVTVRHSIEVDDIKIEITGRIDGVIEEEGSVVIDEIKTVENDLEEIDDGNDLHWGQAKCYAYIYAVQNNLAYIDVQLTYYSISTREIKRFRRRCSFDELKLFFYEVISKYVEWAKLLRDWAYIRDKSIKELSFPYASYRKGQRKLAVATYNAIKNGKKLFVQAPTGIGKTIATIFPAVKAIGEGLTSKVFYLTAKNTNITVAEETLDKLSQGGLRIKRLTITAKEKICFNGEITCDPEKCDYAKGHFDRVKDAIRDIFKEDAFTREKIEIYARKHKVCPFEFSLDLSLWSDFIMCDYNYVFDPKAYIRRHFDNKTDYVFLIDEAHNLVDRAREMFSAELYKKKILHLKKTIKNELPDIAKSLFKMNKYMLKLRKACGEGNFFIQKEVPDEIYGILRNFIEKAVLWLKKEINAPFRQELLELYFDIYTFIRIYELYDEKYVTYAEKIEDEIKLKIFCVDPSKLINKALNRGKAAIFFSATLTPIDYFQQMFGCADDEVCSRLKLASPFPRENMCLLIDNSVSTKYDERKLSYSVISDIIFASISGKRGNYLVFFPSYEYMYNVYERFVEKYPNIKTLRQDPNMTEGERREFLNCFCENNECYTIGFAVMGGIFGEGIDLTGDRLLGVIIIGVGLPQICFERDIIKDYYQKLSGKGFEYAYIYPGMNRVLQAAGRVIRTERDRGIILLIDERFTHWIYKRLFPPEWSPKIVKDENEIKAQVVKFWNEAGLVHKSGTT